MNTSSIACQTRSSTRNLTSTSNDQHNEDSNQPTSTSNVATSPSNTNAVSLLSTVSTTQNVVNNQPYIFKQSVINCYWLPIEKSMSKWGIDSYYMKNHNEVRQRMKEKFNEIFSLVTKEVNEEDQNKTLPSTDTIHPETLGQKPTVNEAISHVLETEVQNDKTSYACITDLYQLCSGTEFNPFPLFYKSEGNSITLKAEVNKKIITFIKNNSFKDKDTGEIKSTLPKGFQDKLFNPMKRFTINYVDAFTNFNNLFNDINAVGGNVFEAMVAWTAETKKLRCLRCNKDGMIRWNSGSKGAWKDMVCGHCKSTYEIKSKKDLSEIAKYRARQITKIKLRGGSFKHYLKVSRECSKLRAKMYIVLVSREATNATVANDGTSNKVHKVYIAELKNVEPELHAKSFPLLFSDESLSLKTNIFYGKFNEWFNVPALNSTLQYICEVEKDKLFRKYFSSQRYNS